MSVNRETLLSLLGINLRIEQGYGARLVDQDGKVYVDALSQYGALPFGQNFPPLLEKAQEFFRSGSPTLVQPFNSSFPTELKEQLRKKTAKANLQHVILTTSGAETVEVAVKMARVKTKRPNIVALAGGFHGKTMAALQLTHNSAYRDYFRVPNDFVEHIDLFGDYESLGDRMKNSESIGAIMIELVQGEGGMRSLPKDKVQFLTQLARDLGILVIIDEIQTGLGRTGSLMAYEDYEIEPDVVLLSKALGGGLVSLGACLANDRAYPEDFDYFHSSTFANNNFAACIGTHVLETINHQFLQTVQDRSAVLAKGLEELVIRHPDVYSHTSGKGLMRGVHLHPWIEPHSYFVTHLNNMNLYGATVAGWLIRERQMITTPCFSVPTCLRVQPPLIIEDSELSYILDSFDSLAESIRRPGGRVVFLMPAEQNQEHTLEPFDSDRVFRFRGMGFESNVQSLGTQEHGRFLFVLHPIDEESFVGTFPDDFFLLPPEDKTRFKDFGTRLLTTLRGGSELCYETRAINLNGKYVSGAFLGLPYFPEEILALGSDDRKKLLQEIALKVSTYQPTALGLGAFSSILARGGYDLRHLDTAVTAGSSLTALSAVHAVLSSNSVEGDDVVGVIGANGSVGQLITSSLLVWSSSQKYPSQIVLLFNPNNPQSKTALLRTLWRFFKKFVQLDAQGQLGSLGFFPETSIRSDILKIISEALNLSKDPQQVYQQCHKEFMRLIGHPLLTLAPSNNSKILSTIDHAFVATNEPQILRDFQHLKLGASLYDLGRPTSISPYTIRARQLHAYEAGLVRLPENLTFGAHNICGLPPGMTLGCLGETIVIAAEGKGLCPSPGVVTLAQAQQVWNASVRLGFEDVLLPIHVGSRESSCNGVESPVPLLHDPPDIILKCVSGGRA